jgi:hypothetical protein
VGLWDDFTGASARSDLRSGRTSQLNALAAGESAASGQLAEGYSTARGMIDPFIASGRGNQQMYDDLMGLNGPEARARAQGVVSSDPQWTGRLGADQNAAMRGLNARGLGGSGAAAIAAQRVLTERYGDVLGRYQQGGQQGMAAAGAGADLSSRYGSERAGLTYGNAQQQAGVEGNYANAMAAGRGTFANNLMGLGSMAIAGFTPGWGGTSAFGNMAGAAGKGMNALWGAGASQPLPGSRPLGQGGIGSR